MRAPTFGHATLAQMRQRWLLVAPKPVVAGLLIGAVTIICWVALGLIYAQPAQTSYDIGATDAFAGLYAPEHNQRFSYAYMHDRVTFEIPNTGRGTYAATLRMGGPGAELPVMVTLGAMYPLVTITDVRDIRIYHIILPTDGTADSRFSLTSTTAQPSGEERQLGALLDTVAFRSFPGTLLPLSALWAFPLALMLVWLISTQCTQRTTIRALFLILAGLGFCIVYQWSRWRQQIAPSWMLNTLIVTGLLVVVARTLIMPRRRAWLRSARWLMVPLAIVFATRLGVIIVAYIADPLISNGMNNTALSTNVIVDVLTARWDSAFYFDIVTHGYFYTPDALSSVAFFPLLPLLIRIFTPVFGSAIAAGLIIVNSALLGAAIMFYRLVEMEWGMEVAERAVWYLLIFPMSFFGSFVYTESLFLFTTIGALLFARRGRWDIAAGMGILAAMSRFVGIAVAPMLLLEWWMQRRRTEARPPLIAALAAFMVPLGTLAYMLYLQLRFGDPLAFVKASAAWGRAPGSPLTMIGEIFQRPPEGWIDGLLAAHIPLNSTIDLIAVLGFIMLGCVLMKQRRWSEASFMFCTILITFNSGLLASQRRYVWVLFPAFVILARWGHHQWVDRLITALFLTGLGLFTAMIANHYWVG